MSNRDRIARAAEEAAAAASDKEKKAKKAPKEPVRSAKKGSTTRTRKSDTPARMKIVWDVCNSNGKAVKTFPYPDKAAAQAAVLALTRSTGNPHVLLANKVPME